MKKSVFEVNDLHQIVPAVVIQDVELPAVSYKITTKEWSFKGSGGTGRTPFKDVIITNHAFTRWNERVGPIVSHLELNNLLKYICLFEPERVERVRAKQLNGTEFDYFILDKEVIAIFTIENGVLIVHTFLGRLSLKPQLQNIKALYTFNVIGRDNTDLQVDADILHNQQSPFGPTKALIINKTSTFYQFELENERAILKIEREADSNSYVFKVVMLKHRNNLELTIFDLMIILKMDNKKFVANYISTNYKEMPDLCEHYSNKALFHFKQKVLYKRGTY